MDIGAEHTDRLDTRGTHIELNILRKSAQIIILGFAARSFERPGIRQQGSLVFARGIRIGSFGFLLRRLAIQATQVTVMANATPAFEGRMIARHHLRVLLPLVVEDSCEALRQRASVKSIPFRKQYHDVAWVMCEYAPTLELTDENSVG